MKKCNIIAISCAIVCIGASAVTVANDLNKSIQKYCERIKTCTFEEIKSQDIPKEYQDMVADSMKNMCNSVKEQYIPYQEDPALITSAQSCIDSLTALSCDTLMNSGSETKQCQAFDKILEKSEL